jgi:Uma2 family endonuclease
MNAPLGLKLDKRAFLQWVQKQERRCEFKDGEVIMHPGGTKRHSWIIGRFVSLLSACLDPNEWSVGPTDIAIEIGPDIRYPDVVVERIHDDGTTLATDTPALLVEVLSPSSVGTDMVEKLAEYTSLPSLEAYIVASQDEPICWVWQRGGKDRSFPNKPEEIAGRDKEIVIAALGITLPMSEIFRGIGTV